MSCLVVSCLVLYSLFNFVVPITVFTKQIKMASNPTKEEGAPQNAHAERVSKDGSEYRDEKNVVEVEEGAVPREWLERYPLIKDKSPEELRALEKSLVRKLDWKFLPMVSIMLIMK